MLAHDPHLGKTRHMSKRSKGEARDIGGERAGELRSPAECQRRCAIGVVCDTDFVPSGEVADH